MSEMADSNSDAEPKPLDGLTVVVTRAKAQASVLTSKLELLGADVCALAMIEIVAPVDDGAALAAAIDELASYDQIVVASPNGARALAHALQTASRADLATLPLVACVGPSTAATLADSPFVVNMVPDRAVAEGLVEAIAIPASTQNRLLLVQAEVARDVLERGLVAKGWHVHRVSAYRTIDADVSDADRVAAARGDIATFTSSSTVERFVRLIGHDSLPAAVASIGPITSATARSLGVDVDVEADPHTIDGLVSAVISWAATGSARGATA